MSMVSLFTVAGDTIMREGTAATKMYFVHEGVVEVLVAGGQEVVATLSDGSYFGETCLWSSGSRRPVSVRADTYCNLFSLSATAFTRVMDRYPKFKDHVTSVLVDRANRMANIGQRVAAGDTNLWHEEIIITYMWHGKTNCHVVQYFGFFFTLHRYCCSILLDYPSQTTYYIFVCVFFFLELNFHYCHTTIIYNYYIILCFTNYLLFLFEKN